MEPPPPPQKKKKKKKSSPKAIFSDCAARFVSDLVGNPEDRFSHNVARSLKKRIIRRVQGHKFRMILYTVSMRSRLATINRTDVGTMKYGDRILNKKLSAYQMVHH